MGALRRSLTLPQKWISSLTSEQIASEARPYPSGGRIEQHANIDHFVLGSGLENRYNGLLITYNGGGHQCSFLLPLPKGSNCPP